MKAGKFFRHPLIAALLVARNVAKRSIREEKGVKDAFDRWLSIDTDNRQVTRAKAVRSLLAQQVQSYELKIILAALPVLKAEGDIRVLSFLHDGMAAWISDKSEAHRKINRLCAAVKEAAEKLRMHTFLEVGE